MDPDSALSAGQLAVMAVVVVVSLAIWLIAVALAARQPHGTSAASNTEPPEQETAAPVTRFPTDGSPAGKTASYPRRDAGAPAPGMTADGTSAASADSRKPG